MMKDLMQIRLRFDQERDGASENRIAFNAKRILLEVHSDASRN
jgi:hypothetical protein